ncbi:MAG: hypothetical protein KC912_06365 [Proteobacteria bacterium]|nr:hypothetical protein [Pseudomonadota bacterium]
MASECTCMDFGVAVTDCVPVVVDEDIWTQVVRHGPGQQKGPLSITNRSIIYRLHPKQGEPFLVILNGVWCDEDSGQPFKGLHALEAETGAKVRYVLAPASSHNLSLIHYAKAFPEAKVCVAQGRIPRVNPELMAMPNAVAYPVDEPPAELGEAGLKVMVVAGLMEGWSSKRVAMMTEFNFSYVPNTTEPLMVLHEPTGTVTSGGHQWMYVPPDEEGVFEAPAMMRFMMKLMIGADLRFAVPGKITLEPGNSFAIHDREAFQQSCREILSWDFDKMLDVHAQPDKNVDSGAKALFEEALAPIVGGDWSAVPMPSGSLPAP